MAPEPTSPSSPQRPLPGSGVDPLPPPPTVPPRLPAWAVLTSGVLLVIPLVALAIVPSYAKATPKLWGFPFFYWYQFLWVLVTAVLTYCAYLIITRARRSGGPR